MSANYPHYLRLVESLAGPSSVAGEGYLWLKNEGLTGPNRPVFTDDLGNECYLAQRVEELKNALITGPTGGDAIVYNSSLQLWTNQQVSFVDTLTSLQVALPTGLVYYDENMNSTLIDLCPIVENCTVKGCTGLGSTGTLEPWNLGDSGDPFFAYTKNGESFEIWGCYNSPYPLEDYLPSIKLRIPLPDFPVSSEQFVVEKCSSGIWTTCLITLDGPTGDTYPASGKILFEHNLANQVFMKFCICFPPIAQPPAPSTFYPSFSYSAAGSVCAGSQISGLVIAAENGGDGAINITIVGGIQPFTIQWADGPTGEDRTNLDPDFYTVTVTDSQGCIATKMFTVSCESIRGLTGINIEYTTLTFCWTDPLATTWDLEYGLTNYDQGFDYLQQVNGVTGMTGTNCYGVTGLTDNTCYDFYIRSWCNGAGTIKSSWNQITFCTKECLPPTNLTQTVKDYTEATLEWTDTNTPPADTWDLEYGATGYSQGATGIINTVYGVTGLGGVTGSYGITGLDDNTQYWFYVRAVCEPGAESDWTQGVFCTKECLPPTNLTQTVKDYTEATLEWTDTNTPTPANEWNLEYGPTGYVQGSTGTLVSGIIGLGGGTGSYGITGLDDNTQYWFYVQAVCEPGVESVWSQGAFCTAECLPPLGLTATDRTFTTATVQWTEQNVPPATTWDLEYACAGYTMGDIGATGYAQFLGVGATGCTGPTGTVCYGLTGLEDNKCYDFYVRAVCEPGAESNWSGPETFCTLECLAPLGLTATDRSFTAAKVEWIDMNSPPTATWDIEYGCTGFIQGTTGPTGGTLIENIQTGCLLAYWPFDEGAGSTGYNYGVNGSTNNATLLSDAYWTPGKINTYALGATGTTLGNATASAVGLPFGDSARTVSLWFKMTSTPSAFGILYQQTGSYVIYVSGTPQMVVHRWGGSHIPFGPTLMLNTWYHIVFVYHGLTNVTLYINGSNYSGNIDVPLNTNSSNSVVLGGGFVYHFFGAIDDVAVFDHELSASDVAYLYNGGTGNAVNSKSFTVCQDSYILTGLQDNKCYDFYVRAVCEPGAESNWSGPETFCTLECLAPLGLTATDRSFTTATLQWTEQNVPPATTWDIEYACAGYTMGDTGATGYAQFLGIGATGCTGPTGTVCYGITGLEFSKCYDFYVRAVCEPGLESDWSQGIFCALAPTPPLAYYPMDEGTGTNVRDTQTPFDNSLTINDLSYVSWINGKFNAGLEITNAIAALIIGDPTSFPTASTSQLSMSIWFKDPGTGALFFYGPNDTTDGEHRGVVINNNTTINITTYELNFPLNGENFTVPDINDGEWHHFVAIFDNQYLGGYHDGVFLGLAGPFGSILDIPSLGYVSICKIGGGIYPVPLLAKVSDAMIFNRVLSQSDVDLLYNGGTGRSGLSLGF